MINRLTKLNKISVIKRIWLIMATVLSVFAIALFLISQRHLIEYLHNIYLTTLAALVSAILFLNIFNGLLLRIVAAKFDIPLTFYEWIGLPFVTAMWNYITPFAGGMLAKASYLKYRHFFPYAKFASVLAASYLIYGWVSGTAGITTLLLLEQKTDSYGKLIILFTGMVLLATSCMLIHTAKIPGTNPVTRFINSALDGWLFIRGDFPLLFRLAIYNLVTIFLNGVAFWLAFRALSVTPVSFGVTFLISILFSFSILIRITPGNLGISEAIITLSSEFMGIGAGIGFMASLLIRATSTIPIFILGPFFSIVLTRKLTGNKNYIQR